MIQKIFCDSSISKMFFFSFFPSYLPFNTLSVCYISSCLVYFLILLIVSKQNGRWMVDGKFSVLHSSLASESSSQECLEAVITQLQGRNGKDFIVSCRMSRKVLRSQVLWVSWVSGLPCLSPCPRIQGG